MNEQLVSSVASIVTAIQQIAPEVYAAARARVQIESIVWMASFLVLLPTTIIIYALICKHWDRIKVKHEPASVVLIVALICGTLTTFVGAIVGIIDLNTLDFATIYKLLYIAQ